MPKRIAVIGAGIAGVACATEFADARCGMRVARDLVRRGTERVAPPAIASAADGPVRIVHSGGHPFPFSSR